MYNFTCKKLQKLLCQCIQIAPINKHYHSDLDTKSNKIVIVASRVREESTKERLNLRIVQQIIVVVDEEELLSLSSLLSLSL